MDTLYIIGQILGVIVIIYSGFIYTSKKRDRILIMKLIADVMCTVQNLLCGAYTGAALLAIAVARDIVFLYKDKYKWANNFLWLVLFSVGMCVSPIVTWAGWTSLLPVLGSLILSIGLYSSNSKSTRLLGVIGQVLWTIYDVCNLNIAGAIADGLSVVLGAITLAKDMIVEKQALPATVEQETAVAQSTEEKTSLE